MVDRADSIIKADIEDKINFEAALNSKNIIVNVENGIAVLSGSVGNYYEKSMAVKSAKNVRGVKGVVDELQVHLGESLKRSDEDIAKAAIHALSWDSSLMPHTIQVIVSHGAVTLSGEVDRQHQRENAYKKVKYLYGVKDIINNITLRPVSTVRPEEVSNEILREFQRSATIDARNIRVETLGSRVSLKGVVRSWAEVSEARRAAWSVPGVMEVDTTQLRVTG